MGGVRGRRGNIVQTFPSVEYDFSPNGLVASTDDYIHIQWEGSNTQPPNQAGEGQDGTDRNNMVAMSHSNWNYPHGKVVGEEPKTFQVGEETFEYRIIEHVDPLEAIQICANFGMTLPEPRDAAFNSALRELWKDEKISTLMWLGMKYIA